MLHSYYKNDIMYSLIYEKVAIEGSLMNIKYNYLHGSENELDKKYNINNHPDPDMDGCEKLYDDIIEAYFKNGKLENNEVKVLEQQFKYYKQYNKIANTELWRRYYLLNNVNPKRESASYKPPFYTIVYKDFYLSSDYIGPSIYWATQKGLSSEIILEILNKCRTIGGHIVWPRGEGTTINQARSGRKSLYDRIDWTLFLIKQFCDNNFDSVKTYTSCSKKFGIDNIGNTEKLLDTLNIYHKWFKEFGDSSVAFINFCKQFKLEDSFVDKEYNIIWFSPPIPFLPDNYDAFVGNNISAIEKRNKQLI